MRACIQIHAVACEDTTQRRDTPPRVPAKHAHIQPPQVRSREGKEAARQQERRDAAARIYDRLRLEAEAKQREKMGMKMHVGRKWPARSVTQHPRKSAGVHH